MKYPHFTDSFLLELPVDQAFNLCLNHMNYVSSHTLKSFSTDNANEQEFIEHLRSPWSFTVEKANLKFLKINENRTQVKIFVTASLPINSYDFRAIKKVLSYLKKTKFFESALQGKP